MNRREFFKRMGRLLVALPFVALADLESKAEVKQLETDNLMNDLMKIWAQSPVETPIKWMPDGETIYGVSVLNNVWDDFPFWERLKEINARNLDYYLLRLDKDDEFHCRNIPLPDSKIVKWNL